jgi:predicted O-methyltransferase YrrM
MARPLEPVAARLPRGFVDRTKHLVGRTVSWNLDALGILWGTDKARGYHGYTRYYARHLRRRRRAVTCVLEIGIGGYDSCPGGNSLRMWRSYFPHATIYGLDLYEKRFEDAHRLVLLQGDQSDQNTLRRVVELYQPFDLVVDDGSHIKSDIIASFEALFPAVTPGGVYAIEDIDAVYPKSPDAGPYDVIDHVASPAKLLSDDLRLGRCAIAAVHSYPGLVLVEKR